MKYVLYLISDTMHKVKQIRKQVNNNQFTQYYGIYYIVFKTYLDKVFTKWCVAQVKDSPCDL